MWYQRSLWYERNVYRSAYELLKTIGIQLLVSEAISILGQKLNKFMTSKHENEGLFILKLQGSILGQPGFLITEKVKWISGFFFKGFSSLKGKALFCCNNFSGSISK